MNTVKSSGHGGTRRAQLALIPVLGLILAGTVFWPQPSAGVPMAADAASPPQVKPVIASPPSSERTCLNWPAIRCADLLEFNPFEPRSMPAPEPTSSATTGNENASGESPADPADGELTADAEGQRTWRQLQAIYQDARGAAAIVDARIVRVGDVLDDGRRIVAITSQGILLERE